MDAKNFIIDVIRWAISINVVDNGEFYETDVNYEEIAEELLKSGVIVPEELLNSK